MNFKIYRIIKLSIGVMMIMRIPPSNWFKIIHETGKGCSKHEYDFFGTKNLDWGVEFNAP